MKTKVLIVIDHLGTGGAQQQVLEYLKYADRRAFDIKIVNLDASYDFMSPYITQLGFDVISIQHVGFFNISTLVTLVRLFHREKPNVVHTYLFTSNCYGRLAAKIAGVKVIVSSIRDKNRWKRFRHILADKILSVITDKITINAEALRPHLISKRGIDAGKIVKIYNGMDTERFKNVRNRNEVRRELKIPTDALVVGMIARFTSQKDYETFFTAAEKVSRCVPNVYFLAIGNGKKREELEQKVISQNKTAKIIFTGVRNDIPDVINALDVGVLSTHYEGCPNVILEYMAGSRPAVATNLDGCSELVIDNETGFLVPESDPGTMSEKIITLLKDADLQIRMGGAGQKRIAEHFTSEKLAHNTENLYRELTKAKIAFIFSQFPRYSETFILRELSQLKKCGLDFNIYSLRNTKDRIVHDEAKDLIESTFYLPFFSPKVLAINLFYIIRYPIRYFSAFFSVFFGNIKCPNFFIKTLIAWPKTIGFAHLAKRQKITHVHGQWATYPATMALVISKLLRIPFSFTGHAHDIHVDTTMLAEKMHAAEFITTCTADNKRHLLNVVQNQNKRYFNPEKITVNYHGVELDRFTRTSKRDHANGSFHVLSVGSLLECKGFDDLINACAMLKERNIPFKCTIAGGGKLETQLRTQVAQSNLGDTVELTGYITQDKLIPIYQKADVFVLSMVPGIHWGIPNVLMEAIAAGLPIICTMLPSIPELIKNGETGLIIPTRNPSAIADAIEKLYRDSELREKLAISAQRIVEDKFDAVKNAKQLRDLFLVRP